MSELPPTDGWHGERIRETGMEVRPVRPGNPDVKQQPISIIVCRPYGFRFRTVEKCPREGVLRRMVGLDEIYHGLSHTCLGCGESWQDGFSYRMPPHKPAPDWRIKARRTARKLWKTAKPYGGPEHTEWDRQEMEEILGDRNPA